ncbi:MAG: 2Fe-2S iron-sulfur cluster-binding protein [Fulvivirga sp.]|nr:2Fe-2S iron-sulfur cluster-binding protein [Fulvivirga sp.]
MPQITVANLSDKTIETNDKQSSVLKVLHENFIDWMHACGGKGRCTTCKMIVERGLDNLSPHSEFEMKVKKWGALNDNERLACQCSLGGDIVIRVPHQNKLPHVRYSDD